ncbi:hypothetical protein PISMIDRAFT_250233 [Pisolithus microcarpus 441]|uniref:Uncharacterized protein n=1 Tax=Pisolithus microcarpus 441 TaxID=765257 RepID=A0A0C9XWJ5_9AGAM|nr:hypothetical protein PISMIDRAFT_250233 [Pisolithus microcarpus 441]
MLSPSQAHTSIIVWPSTIPAHGIHWSACTYVAKAKSRRVVASCILTKSFETVRVFSCFHASSCERDASTFFFSRSQLQLLHVATPAECLANVRH